MERGKPGLPIAGCLLAGGLSRRMGGNDKSLIELGGKTLARHAIDRLRPQVTTLFINANGDPSRFSDLALPVVADEISGHQGPLAGVEAALSFAARYLPGITHVLTSAADTPFIPRDLATRLWTAGKPGDIIVARSAAGTHPVCALWPLAVAPKLREALAAGERKVMKFVEDHPHAEAEFEPIRSRGNSIDPFFNINTPDDLKTAEAFWTADGDIPPGLPVIGVAGWKNSGKTTLVVRLVSELVSRGFRVSTVKHAHHKFDIDREGTDSWRHREAGAQEVCLVSIRRVASQLELRGDPEPPLGDILTGLAPTDIIIVEGFKESPIPKIEIRRLEAKNHDPLVDAVPNVVAIVADHPVADLKGLPGFSIDAIGDIADLVAQMTAGKTRP